MRSTQVAAEQNRRAVPTPRILHANGSGSQDVSGVVKRGRDTGRDF